MIRKVFILLLVVLAAASKATADTLADHFGSSIFKNLDPKFWDKNVSWQYGKFLPLTKFRVDGWHIANSIMIWAFLGAIAIQLPYKWYWKLAGFVAIGTLFNLDFNLFYNHIYKY
jgi:hypothetical protein